MDLIDSLRNGHLAGAALDVVTDEHAVTKDNPLIQYANGHDNLIITPHIGGNTFESFVKTESFIADRVITLFSNPE